MLNLSEEKFNPRNCGCIKIHKLLAMCQPIFCGCVVLCFTPNLQPFICIVPFFIIFLTNILSKNKADLVHSFLAISLCFGLNGVLTNTVKLIVGRPRPDFFFRCFPDGKGDMHFPCTGKHEDIVEGLKSFPSGHSSFAFASMTFCSLYLCGKLHVFNARGRGKSGRLLVSLMPLMAALAVALSRTCDYHHHWQDVLVGSLIGALVSGLCYFQYYPALDHPQSSLPCASVRLLQKGDPQLQDEDMLQKVSVKWI